MSVSRHPFMQRRINAILFVSNAIEVERSKTDDGKKRFVVIASPFPKPRLSFGFKVAVILQ